MMFGTAAFDPTHWWRSLGRSRLDPRVRTVIGTISEDWLNVLDESLGDRDVARAIKLIGDGFYHHAIFTELGGRPPEAAKALIAPRPWLLHCSAVLILRLRTSRRLRPMSHTPRLGHIRVSGTRYVFVNLSMVLIR
jgi:hypothetical protein